MAKDAPKHPERTAYSLERRPGNTWAVLTLTLRGDSVVKSEESEPDAFFSQVERVGRLLKRLV